MPFARRRQCALTPQIEGGATPSRTRLCYSSGAAMSDALAPRPPDRTDGAPSAAAPGGLARAAHRAAGLVAQWPRTTAALVMLASTVAVWAPHLRADRLVRYWDGPLYLYMSRVLYDVPAAHPFVAYDLPPIYFASHMPLYPMLIRALSVLTGGHAPAAMMLATVATSVLAAVLFFEVVRQWDLVRSPLWTAVLFSFLPPRWLIYHSVGATEPLFFCCVFAAFLAYRNERMGWLALFVGLACLTRITGVLLVPSFGLALLTRRHWAGAAAVGLSLVGLLGLFAYYHVHFGDFFAYSRWNIDRLSMVSVQPFAGFMRAAEGGNYRVVELYVGTYLVYALGTLALWRHREVFFYAAAFFLLLAFVFAKDLPRYLIAIAPFSLLVGYDEVLSRPVCRWGLLLMVYLGYAAAWTAIPQNMVSRAVWADLLRVIGER